MLQATNARIGNGFALSTSELLKYHQIDRCCVPNGNQSNEFCSVGVQKGVEMSLSGAQWTSMTIGKLVQRQTIEEEEAEEE